MDITTLGAAIAAKAGQGLENEAKKEAVGFLKTLFGPWLEVEGEIIALRRRERLFNNLVETFVRAQAKVKASGIPAKAVPLKVIHRLLENASLEEDPDLREMWANLLAKAATSRRDVFHSQYAAVLAQLTGEQVRFLNAIYEEKRGQGTWQPKARILADYTHLQSTFYVANPHYGNDAKWHLDYGTNIEIGIEYLCRLGIIVQPPTGDGKEQDFSLSAFGFDFLRCCCAPPAKPRDDGDLDHYKILE